MVAGLLIDTLAPRTDVHNVWNPAAGHYVVARDHGPDWKGWGDRAHPDNDACPLAPLTPAAVVAALHSRGTVGAYHPGADGTTHVGVVDCDRDDDGTDVARQVVAVMAARGIPAYTELSQDHRAHVWVVGPRLPALVWQYAMLAACAAAGYPATTAAELLKLHRLEVRPNGATGNGAGMRLPGLWHPKTGKQYPMLAPDGTDLGTRPSGWLPVIELAPGDALVSLAELHTPPAPAVIPPRSRERRAFDDDTTATQVLTTLYGVPNAAPGRSIRCPLHDDKRASLSILRDDRRVICRAGGCPANGVNGRGLWPSELALLARGGAA